MTTMMAGSFTIRSISLMVSALRVVAVNVTSDALLGDVRVVYG